MSTLQLKTALHVFLAIAFLSLQGAGAHIHLGEHHERDGNRHAHVSQVRSHSVASQHADSICTPDTSVHEHSAGHDHVVEISHKCSTPGWNQLADTSVAFVPQNYAVFESCTTLRIACVDVVSSQKPRLSYSTVRLRALPTKSSMC